MSEARHIAASVLAPALALAVAIAVFPRIPLSLGVAAGVTFFGAAALSVLSVSLGARRATSGRSVAVIDGIAVVVLLAVAFVHARSPWITVVVDSLLIAFAWATGGLIGERVEHPSHLMPAAAVAAAADVVSVGSSWGPSAAIASSERALSVLAISFPVPGTHAVAPVLGVGDLVFIALALGVARRHALPYRRMTLLSLLGVLLAGIGSAVLGRAVPALPAIGAMLIAFVPGARALRRKDRNVATIAIGVSIVVALFAIVRFLR